MAKSLTAADIDELSRLMVNDVRGTLFSSEHVLDAINFSILEYVKLSESCPKFLSVTLSAGSGTVAIPVDALTVSRVTVSNTVA